MRAARRERPTAVAPHLSDAFEHGPMTQLPAWRRRHSAKIVTEVTPVSGIGIWEAHAWREPDHADCIDAGCHFSFLTDAHHAADALAAITFRHRCDAGCGAWSAEKRRHKP